MLLKSQVTRLKDLKTGILQNIKTLLTVEEGKKQKLWFFHKMDTEEVSDKFVAPCFVNGLEAYDGEINLGVEENMISNEYAVKLCLEHEVKRGNKIVKKELIVALRGEIYFVKFIINPEEDDVEPGVIFERSFLRMTKAITDFGVETIIIYPDIDPFLENTEEEEKSMDDWDQLLDFNLDDIPLLGGEELPPFVRKMGKCNHNKKKAMENLNLFYQDIGTSSSTGRHLTQEEAAKEALVLRISQKFALLEEVRPVLETMAYHDKYKKVLDKIWKDKVELDGMIIKEEEETIKKVRGEALKEKDDPEAFIFPIRSEGQVNKNALANTGSDINTMPYRIYEQLGREEMKKVDRGIIMINHTQAEAMGILTNVLCQVGITTLIAKFPILDIPIDHDAPIVVGQGFLRMIGGIVNTPERLFLTFDGFCHPTFCAARSDTMGGNDADAGSSRSKRSRQFETIEEVLLPQVHHDFLLWEGCNNEGCDGEIDDMLMIKLREAESNEEIFTFVAWIRAFNIKEPIYAKLCHEFYSTYEFNEVCADDELQSKKIIKFRLGGRAHNLTLLEFARRLGLYHANELEEDGFDVCFQGGLRSDDNFNALEYWLSISREENLGLSKSHASTIRNLILRVIHKMITYGLCQRTTRYDKIQKNDLWLLSMFDARHQNGYANFITKIASKARVLTDVVLRSLSAQIYCRDLDMTTLRELINFEGRLIPEDPQPGVSRVGIPRPPRASMQDLYDRMCSMEICQEAIERMEYR
ncbi:retrotransposon ORF1 [Tanacetum coccineum]